MKARFAIGVFGFLLAAQWLGLAPAARSSTPAPTPTPVPGCTSEEHTFTFNNHCGFPVWVAEQGDTIDDTVLPQAGNWMVEAGESATFCMPSGWRGRFWPRTGCWFLDSYPDFAECLVESDCSGGKACYGGTCVPRCDPPNDTNAYCQGNQGLGNPTAICKQVNGNAVPNKGYVCLPEPGTVCESGDCAGLLQCFGSWEDSVGGTLTAQEGGSPPTTLVEPTLDSGGADNYDVSLVSGYNVETKVSLPGQGCPVGGCTTDLLSTCPADLQVTVPPEARGTIPCGTGTNCRSGICVGGDTCVIGCNDPCDQCTQSDPAGLECSSTVGMGTATNLDMYCVKNTADGNPMASCLSGTPVCFADDDCPPAYPQCTTTGLPKSVPTGSGVCTTTAGEPDAKGCTMAGASCGNDPAGVGYACALVNQKNDWFACLPPTTAGLGTLVSGPPTLYSGCGGVFNPDWITAAETAGTAGTPFYETFKNACPSAYAWSYDDVSSDYSCPDSGQYNGFQIDFCASAMEEATECTRQDIARGVAGCVGSKMRARKRGARSTHTPRSRIDGR